MEDFLSFVTIDFWEMIFTWGNLLILLLLMKKFLFKPVKNILDKRQNEIDASYSEAEKANEEASALKAEYEDRLSAAKDEATVLITDATRRASLAEEEILRDAHVKAEKIIARAEEQTELDRQNAIGQVKNEISDIAIALASKIIEKEISKDDHEKMIDNFIDSVDDSQDNE